MNEGTWFEQELRKFEQDFDFRLDRTILYFLEDLSQSMEEEGISRAQLAARLGKSKSYVTRVLNGQPNLTLKTMLQLSEAVDRSLHLELRRPQFEAGTGVSCTNPTFEVIMRRPKTATMSGNNSESQGATGVAKPEAVLAA